MSLDLPDLPREARAAFLALIETAVNDGLTIDPATLRVRQESAQRTVVEVVGRRQ